MFFGRNLKVIFVATISIVFITIAPLLAREFFPTPTGTQETKQEVRKMMGSEFNLSYYTSILGIEEIKSFYRANLPALGWEEKGLLDDFMQVETLQNNAQLKQVLEKTLVFEKDKEVLIVNFIPTKPGSQTQFSLSRGELADISEGAQPDAQPFMVPELVAKPKKNVAPRYPGASLTFLSEPQGAQRAVYVTGDDMQAVAAFFKEKMPGYGWQFQREEPAVKVESGAKSTSIPVETWVSRLKFSKQGQEECEIVLSYIKTTDKLPKDLAATTIVVNYEKKR